MNIRADVGNEPTYRQNGIMALQTDDPPAFHMEDF